MAYSDPKVLYSIPGIKAYHIQNGTEESLTPTGPQTLSLLMVPTSSPFSDLSTTDPSSAAPEEDFYLHLHLPPELDLPLPATTQIYHQPPRSYLIPRWDLGPESGAFTRIEFPKTGSAQNVHLQEDIDTFETILAQCTAFLERAPVPGSSSTSGYKGERGDRGGSGLKPYNPADYAPGEAYVTGSSSSSHGGQIVLIDEENGSVVGELGEGYHVVELSDLKTGSKDPVEITLPSDGSQNVTVAPASPEYIEMAMHPVYKNSKLVSRAAAASRLIVTTSSYVGSALQSQADSFTRATKPNSTPMTFTETTHARVRKINFFSQTAAGLSAKTVGQINKYAQNIGASMAKRGGGGGGGGGGGNSSHSRNDSKTRGGGGSLDPTTGAPLPNYKPGILNKSLMAFSTIADGVDQAGRNLLASTSTAASTVVGHRWGAEAGELSRQLGGGVKNVGLVYIDAAGVSRRAILKSVAKGMVVGRFRNGADVIVGGGDGGVVAPAGAPGAAPAADSASTARGPATATTTTTTTTSSGRTRTSTEKQAGPGPGSSGLNWKEREALEGRHVADDYESAYGRAASTPEVVGFGNAAAPPPAYQAGGTGNGGRQEYRY